MSLNKILRISFN